MEDYCNIYKVHWKNKVNGAPLLFEECGVTLNALKTFFSKLAPNSSFQYKLRLDKPWFCTEKKKEWNYFGSNRNWRVCRVDNKVRKMSYANISAYFSIRQHIFMHCFNFSQTTEKYDLQGKGNISRKTGSGNKKTRESYLRQIFQHVINFLDSCYLLPRYLKSRQGENINALAINERLMSLAESTHFITNDVISITSFATVFLFSVFSVIFLMMLWYIISNIFIVKPVWRVCVSHVKMSANKQPINKRFHHISMNTK